MDGQISLFDYQIVQDNGYKTFHEYCKHRGWLRGGTDEIPATWMCGKGAKCWNDWIPCTEKNCPLLKEQK